MKIEKINRLNQKYFYYALILGVVLLVTVSSIFSYAKYQRIEDIKLVEGNINYKPYDFKMMAMYKSDDGTNYTEIDTLPESGYLINEEKSYCTVNNVDKDNNARIYTNNGEHIIKNLSKNEKCYLYFDNATTAKSIDELVNKLSKIAKIESPDFSKIATTDEGVYKERDGMYGGYSYYWRGASTTNYVKFGGYCWRIVRINGDGTMRLIYDGTTCHNNGEITTDSIVTNTAYNTNYNKSEYVGWTYTEGLQRPTNNNEGTDTSIKITLENWYNINLKSQETKIADGKFCNDRNVDSGYVWSSAPNGPLYYLEYKRLYINYVPILSCTSPDIYTLKIGLITADEVMYAGGKDDNNLSYYLYNGQNYWTMSPCNWDEINTWSNVFALNLNGNLSIWYVGNTYGMRPVINLKADTQILTGNGSIGNPYIIN